MNFNEQTKKLYELEKDQDDCFIWKRHEHRDFPSHFHAAMEIYFVLTGKMEATINGQSYLMRAGDIFVINPFEIHSYKQIDESLVAVLIFHNKYLDDFHKDYPKQQLKTHVTDSAYNEQIYTLLKEIPSSLYPNRTLSNLARKGYVNLVLDMLVSKYGVATSTPMQENITKIMSYIYENYNQPITLETLSAQFNYTKTSLSRLLSKHLKVDLRTFINNLRVEQADLFLSDQKYEDLSILQIAYLCRFESPATFYRAYHRRYNHPPRKHIQPS